MADCTAIGALVLQADFMKRLFATEDEVQRSPKAPSVAYLLDVVICPDPS